MGLFDVFKKKQNNVQITWEATTNENKKYNPWAKTGTPINDDYAIAAFIRISENGAKIGQTNDDYARYFNYEFGVYDPIKYHKYVIANGYLVEAAPEVALGKLKVDQLKLILSDAGLQGKGKNTDLISQIVSNVDISSLNLDRYYVPSEKGATHLKQYEYIFRLRDYGISQEEFDKAKKTYSVYCTPNDIIWKILNNRFNAYNINGSFALARNDLFHMAKLLEYEGKNVDALYHYVLVLYYDMNGGGIGEIAPGVIERIHSLKENYDDRIISRCYDRYRLPRHYISRDKFKELLFDIFSNKTIDMKNYTGKKIK